MQKQLSMVDKNLSCNCIHIHCPSQGNIIGFKDIQRSRSVLVQNSTCRTIKHVLLTNVTDEDNIEVVFPNS